MGGFRYGGVLVSVARLPVVVTVVLLLRLHGFGYGPRRFPLLGSGYIRDHSRFRFGFIAQSSYALTSVLGAQNKQVVLMHYDLWHRGGANISDGIRYMFKFQPLGPSRVANKPLKKAVSHSQQRGGHTPPPSPPIQPPVVVPKGGCCSNNQLRHLNFRLG